MWAAPDDALLAGLAAGDEDAAVSFVRRFQRRVFGLALAVVGDAAVAEEVSQEAFARAWAHAGAYDPRRGSVVTWLLAITRHLAIDAVRLRRSVAVDPGELLALPLASAALGPADVAFGQHDAGRLREALGLLPVDQQRAVVLAGILGRTALEVSEAEGVPLGTAKTRIRTGLLKLRAMLTSESQAE